MLSNNIHSDFECLESIFENPFLIFFFAYVFCRMTLLLGPPSSGKTTLLLALAGKLDPDLKVKIISVQAPFVST
jgi:stage III sporulation protein SpoIIIAA